MSQSVVRYTVTFGGWYQRTTLHLSEIYDFLALKRSQLDLNLHRLTSLHQQLEIVDVERKVDLLEYIEATTADGIVIRYYEDGLYILELQSHDIIGAQNRLKHYFHDFFNPAISYIFSLGAPTPKELAKVKSVHPTVISYHSSRKVTTIDQSLFGQVYSVIHNSDLSVFKTPEHIVVVTYTRASVRSLIETQIFFREFKDQLERYLQIHRTIWEEISLIKERGSVLGHEVANLRSRLDSHDKTINLISSRINQMGSYVHTRASIAKSMKVEKELLDIFQYKFETLSDTHSYIKEIWVMTREYLRNAIQVINEVQSLSTANGIQSLRLITTIGVLAGIFGYLSKTEFPAVTGIGLWYFVVLILATWLINRLIGLIYQRRRYELKFTDPLTR